MILHVQLPRKQTKQESLPFVFSLLIKEREAYSYKLERESLAVPYPTATGKLASVPGHSRAQGPWTEFQRWF